MLGIWDNFEEMEEKITFEELEAILKAKGDNDFRHWKFQASLKGIDLDSGQEEEMITVEDKIQEIKARQAGMDEDTYALAQLGIAFETEGEG